MGSRCAWQGGIHGGGACMAGGHAWQGVCMPCMPPSPADTTAMAYGQWVGGTHPTGMHSCLEIFYFPNNPKSADGFILSRNSDFGEEI